MQWYRIGVAVVIGAAMLLAVQGVPKSAHAATVPLPEGCTTVTIMFPGVVLPQAIAAAITPAESLRGIWSTDPANPVGYTPGAPEASNPFTIAYGDQVLICMAGPGSLQESQREPATTDMRLYYLTYTLREREVPLGLSPFALPADLSGSLRLCATLLSTERSEGYLIVDLRDRNGAQAGPASFTRTDCRDMELSSGPYTLRPFSQGGAWRLEISGTRGSLANCTERERCYREQRCFNDELLMYCIPR